MLTRIKHLGGDMEIEILRERNKMTSLALLTSQSLPKHLLADGIRDWKTLHAEISWLYHSTCFLEVLRTWPLTMDSSTITQITQNPGKDRNSLVKEIYNTTYKHRMYFFTATTESFTENAVRMHRFHKSTHILFVPHPHDTGMIDPPLFSLC